MLNQFLFKICFKISQALFNNFVKLKIKFTQNLLKIFSAFFQFAFFFEFRENFLENLQKILINYLEIKFNFTYN